jgi:hypothetical protein
MDSTLEVELESVPFIFSDALVNPTQIKIKNK